MNAIFEEGIPKLAHCTSFHDLWFNSHTRCSNSVQMCRTWKFHDNVSYMKLESEPKSGQTYWRCNKNHWHLGSDYQGFCENSELSLILKLFNWLVDIIYSLPTVINSLSKLRHVLIGLIVPCGQTTKLYIRFFFFKM